MYHLAKNYTVAVSFIYDSTKIQDTAAEAGISSLLAPLGSANTHTDRITALKFFGILSDSALALEGLSSVSIVGVQLSVGTAARYPMLTCPWIGSGSSPPSPIPLSTSAEHKDGAAVSVLSRGA